MNWMELIRTFFSFILGGSLAFLTLKKLLIEPELKKLNKQIKHLEYLKKELTK